VLQNVHEKLTYISCIVLYMPGVIW